MYSAGAKPHALCQSVPEIPTRRHYRSNFPRLIIFVAQPEITDKGSPMQHTRVIRTLLFVGLVWISPLLSPSVGLSSCGSSSFTLTKSTYPVIFVHGIWGSSSTTWGTLKTFLCNSGWGFGGSPAYDRASGQVTGVFAGAADFYTLNFSDNQHLYFDEQGFELAAIIEAVLSANPEKEKVVLVGHSMGGLAAREYLQGLARLRGAERSNHSAKISYRGDVAKLITIGTPHGGVDLAVFGSALLSDIGMDINSEAVNDLKPNSPAFDPTSPSGLNNLAGNHLRPEIEYVSIIGKGISVILDPLGSQEDGDGVVSVTSQNLGSLAGTSGLNHESKSIAVQDRFECDIVWQKSFGLFRQTHTCEPSDNGPTLDQNGNPIFPQPLMAGVRLEIVQQIPRFSVVWDRQPPPFITSGNAFTVSWSINHTDAFGIPFSDLAGCFFDCHFGHTNVHYDTIPDLSPETCLSRSSCRSSAFQAGHNGTFTSEPIPIPTVTSATTYYFAVHAEIDGLDALSTVIPVLVVPPHALVFNSGPSGHPNPMASGGTVNLIIDVTDTLGHTLSKIWTASCPSSLGSQRFVWWDDQCYHMARTCEYDRDLAELHDPSGGC
jgi:pimeloyl-ACP methyl ester carboxylesterase